VRFLAVEGGVELEPGAADGESQLLDPLHEERRDSPAAMVGIDHQLVDVADGPFVPEAALEGERGETDDVRVELRAEEALAGGSESPLERAPQRSVAKLFVRPVLPQESNDGAKIIGAATSDSRHECPPDRTASDAGAA